jgi:hypothetical protein
MKTWMLATTFMAGLIAGCMAGGPATTARPLPTPGSAPGSAAGGGPLGSPFSERHDFAATLATPLIIDRTDVRLGTTVQFDRIPTAADLNNLLNLPGLAHVVVSLADWPADFEPLQALGTLPEECDLIAVLPGYPPSRAAAEAWNYLGSRLRLVVVVTGPPPTTSVINDLNAMRYLERVIAQMDEPTRTGFDRLQRPLSFRKVVE